MTGQLVDGANRAHPKARPPAAITVLYVLLPLAAASLAAHSLFVGKSLAYYRHDWGWPATKEQLFLSFWRDVAAWDSSGLGQPNHQPLLHPVLLLWHACALVLPTWFVGAATIFVSIVIYGLGVAACCRKIFGVPLITSALLGSAAILGAPLYEKIVAGHIYYIIALASYPWALRFSFARDGNARTNALAAAAAAALCAIQVQLFVAAVVTVLAGGLSSRRRAAWIVVAALASFTLLLPEIAAYANADVLKSVGSMQTTLAYQYNNSSPLLQAFVAMGYASGYYAHALAATSSAVIVKIVLWCLVAAGVFGAILNRRDPVACTLLAIWAIAACLVAGLYGPPSMLLDYAYAHELWASAFRELYHFAAIEWTVLCILVAAAVRRLTAGIGAGLVAAAVLVLSVPWWAPNFAGQLVPAPTPAQAITSLSHIAEGGEGDRFLLLPAEWPLQPTGFDSSGEDPLAYAVGNHPTANMYRLDGVLEAAAALTESARASAARWRAVAGIGTVVSRGGVQEDLSARYPPIAAVPQYVRNLMRGRVIQFDGAAFGRPTCLLCAYYSLPILRDATDPASGDAFLLLRDSGMKYAGDPDLARAAQYVVPSPSFQTIDPSRGWIAAASWAWLDPRIALNPDGVLSWSSAALSTPPAQRAVYAHVLLLHGRLWTDKGALSVPLGRPVWVALPDGARSLHVAGGLAVVNRFVKLDRHSRMRIPPADYAAGPRLSFDWRAEKGTGTIPPGTRFVVLKQAYSSQWRLDLSAGRVLRHFVASGYANGWQVRVDKPTQVRVYYLRTTSNDVLLAVSLLLWIAVVLAAIVKK